MIKENNKKYNPNAIGMRVRNSVCTEPSGEAKPWNAREIKMLIIFVFAQILTNAHGETGWTFHLQQSTDFDSSRFEPNTEISN